MAEEKIAIGLLTRAVSLDKQERFTESLVCYQEGIQILTEIIKGLNDPKKKTHFTQKAKEYLDRAEQIRDHVELEKSKGSYHEKMAIESGAIGFSYETVFGRFLGDSVKRVEVEDPYIRAFHQVQNFLRLCELICRKCPHLKTVHLVTTKENHNTEPQQTGLAQLTESLKERGVTFNFQFSETIHDREIRLDTGWIIRIGRGLDYFKPSKSKYSLGYYDLDLRPCLETTVDIYHKSKVTKIG